MTSEQWYQKGLDQHQKNKPAAIQAYKKCLEKDPNHASGLANLAILLFEMGNIDRAIVLLTRVTQLRPEQPTAHKNLGNAFRLNKQFNRAYASYRQAGLLGQRDTETLFHMAECAFNSGDYLAAQSIYESIEPQLRQTTSNLIVWNNMGLIALQLENLDSAEEWFKQIVNLQPELADPYGNLGLVAKKREDAETAIYYFRQAIDRKNKDKQKAKFLCALGSVYVSCGRIEDGLSCFKQQMNIFPHDAAVHANYLYTHTYLSKSSLEENKTMAEEWARRHTAHIKPFKQRLERKPGKIRVGFVSGDFKNHPVALFLKALFKHYDRQKAEWYCFSSTIKRDEMTRFFEQEAHEFISILGTSDEDAACQIKQKDIDMLIDIAGHTAHNRLKIFAYRPAPIQLAWLGYVNTTGLNVFDFRLTDRITTPPESQASFTEPFLYLPDCYYCFSPSELAYNIAPQKAPSLSKGHITFGCFNNPAKISEECARMFSAVMAAIPKSKLLLKARIFTGEGGIKPIRERLVRHGIDAQRLIFEPGSDLQNYFKAYQKIDIALDT